MSSELAQRLARGRHGLAFEAGRSAGTFVPPWDELDDQEQAASILEAQHYLAAAARAGSALAALGDAPLSPPSRLTATIRATGGQPVDRDTCASHLRARAGRGRGEPQRPLLATEEAQAVAELLAELADVYHGEDLGHLAREIAITLYDRLGI